MKTVLFAFLFASASVLGGTLHAATLIHQYTFDDGTADDSIGNIDGTLVGGASISGGILMLDGTDDYVQLSGNAIPTGGADFSLVMQVAANTPLARGFVEIISQGGSGGPGFYVGHAPNGQFRLSDNFPGTGVNVPTDGLFHTYVLTSGDNFGTQFYIDGVNVFSDVEMNISAVGTATRIGRQFAPFAEFFNGEVDYVGIYDGELAGGVVPPPAPIPLPAGFPLLLAGLIGLGAMRQRARPS